MTLPLLTPSLFKTWVLQLPWILYSSFPGPGLCILTYITQHFLYISVLSFQSVSLSYKSFSPLSLGPGGWNVLILFPLFRDRPFRLLITEHLLFLLRLILLLFVYFCYFSRLETSRVIQNIITYNWSFMEKWDQCWSSK